jgi:hypothetical protein
MKLMASTLETSGYFGHLGQKSTALWAIWAGKGQLISKCPFGVKTSSKKPTKLGG